ncbi:MULTISPECIES: hypothetical protein [unclassified Pseudodesulfovibrio]|uniref:hypothetical protein n=1 Tax=unclassified Pseudodesulfovibrio TaxID=2661612 RepID=UPI000FEBF293|nr:MULTISPECIES: hypothetical protein [unclassified Pseudodesulfovibrio]MCJ2163539.1 hypothetical protein [Pseudodesulfovibrio sp. S3-i]RWU06774.1 hypothetical protein DWB63_03145 [Pseudodesulfovibrio sp. S3]
MLPQRYWEIIDQILKEIESAQLSVYSCFDPSGDAYLTPLVREAIEIRVRGFSEKDEKDYRSTVETSGVYGRAGLTDDERMALILIGVDVKQQIQPRECQRCCESYHVDAPVFRKAPELWNLVRDDLVSVNSGVVAPSGQLIRYPSFLCRLHGHLPKHFILYETLFKVVGRNRLYLRVDQYDDSQSDVIYALEEVIRPMDPTFLKQLKIFRGEKKWGYYEVLPPEHPTDYQYWDYHQGFGKLEVVFKRNGDDLSCMIEELPREADGRVLTSLCLHATSKCPVDTDWNDAVADHIDGAIQFYFDERALERFDSNISVAECDASCRTHLFRIEETSLSNLLPIAKMFFQAESLLKDWVDDQFRFFKPSELQDKIV